MAADYIPIKLTLPDDLAVSNVADALGIKDLDLIVGKLVRFWIYVSRNTKDGQLPGLTAARIDDTVKLRGFADALCKTKPTPWLVQTGDGYEVPNFDHWLSDAAKAREGRTLAKRIERQRGKGCRDKCSDNVATHCDPPARQAESREQRADSREQRVKKKDIAAMQDDGYADPAGTAQPPPAPIAAFSSREGVCSLLLALKDIAGQPLYDPKAAAAIAQHSKATVEQVTWAVGRLKAKMGTESGRKAIKSEAAYLRGLIERNTPPAGWSEEFRREQLRRMAGKGAA